MEDLRFACVWQKLCECYSNNGRSIERAYGYFSEIDNLYSNVVGGTTVQRIVFTNVRVERAEHRDALVAAATNKGIFYAVLTLTATEDVSVATGRGDWWQESLVFAGVDRDDIFTQLFDDANRVDACLLEEDEDEDPQEVREEDSPEESEECEERRQLDANEVPDVPMLETHPLLTEEMDVSTSHYFDSSDEEEDDVGGNGKSGQLYSCTWCFAQLSWTCVCFSFPAGRHRLGSGSSREPLARQLPQKTLGLLSPDELVRNYVVAGDISPVFLLVLSRDEASA